MIETEEMVKMVAADVRNHVKAGNVPLLTKVLSLGRRMATGAIQIIGEETYAGPNGQDAPYAYIRYRDGSREHTFGKPNRARTSTPETEVRAMLRIVVVHRCKNEGALQSSVLAALLMSAERRHGAFDILLQAGSASGTEVIQQETNEKASFLGEASLLALDFDLTYRMYSDETACNFECNACC